MGRKVVEWLRRYGPAEIISVPATLLPALLVQRTTHDAIAAAFAGTWGGNIGYFGTILLQDIFRTRRALMEQGRAYTFRTFGKNLRALLIEFGFAELFDSFLVRPALMYYLPRAFGDFSMGIIAAKLIADLSFYLPAIIFYEWSKERYRKF